MLRHLLVAVFVLLGTLNPALADGKFFGTYQVPPVIPDQEALIAFDRATSTQTLVIQTRFAGDGTDFAWVVPIPGGLDPSRPVAPEIFATTRGFFPTLRTLFQPHVARPDPPLFPVLIFASLGLGAILVMKKRLAASIAFLMFALVGVFFLLPALGKARGSSPDAVAILDRQLVGVFETTTVASTDPVAMTAWLADAGFKASPASHKVIAEYVAEGWVFVVSRVRRDLATTVAAGQPGEAHPLGFRFKSTTPVYPMRLTAVENGPISLHLYVFGPGTARAANFSIERSSVVHPVPTTTPPDRHLGFRTSQLRIGHEGVLSAIGAAPHATKIVATLSPAAQAADVRFDFVEPIAMGEQVWMTEHAVQRALNWGSGALATLLLLLCSATVIKPRPLGAVRRSVALATLVSIALGSGVFVITPRLNESAGPVARVRSSYLKQSIEQAAFTAMLEAEKRTPDRKPTAADIRASVRAQVAPQPDDGMPVGAVEIDAPLGYEIVDGPEGVELHFYDVFGSRRVFPFGK